MASMTNRIAQTLAIACTLTLGLASPGASAPPTGGVTPVEELVDDATEVAEDATENAASGVSGFDFVKGAVGFLFSAYGSYTSRQQEAALQQELGAISSQLTNIQTNLADLKVTVDHVSCQLDGLSYQLSNTDPTAIITKINRAVPLLEDLINNPQNRAQDAAAIQQIFAGTNWTDTSWTAMHSLIYNQITGIGGPTGTDAGLINKLSDDLTSCHAYFNYNDSQILLAQWAHLMMLQAHACTLEVNLWRLQAASQTSLVEAEASLRNANQTSNDCQAYVKNLQALKPSSAISDPNTVVDVKSNLFWQLDTSGPNSGMYPNTCQQGFIANGVQWVTGTGEDQHTKTAGDWMTYCTIPGKGQSGAPWQTLPYYRDIHTFLTNSDCIGGSQDLATCLNGKGFPVPTSPSFAVWANSTPFFGTTKSGNGKQSNVGNANYTSYDDVEKRWGISSINPPCWVYGQDTSMEYTTHWQCGTVDLSSTAQINQASDATAAWFMRLWVGAGAADGAPGQTVSGYWWDDQSFANAVAGFPAPDGAGDVTLNALSIVKGNNQTVTSIGACMFYCFDQLSVQVKDDQGNPVSGTLVTFSCQSCMFPNGLTSIAVSTDNTGVATLTGTDKESPPMEAYGAGVITVTATAPNAFPITFTETVAPSSPSS